VHREPSRGEEAAVTCPRKLVQAKCQLKQNSVMCDSRAVFQQAQENYLSESLALERQCICINMNEVAIIVKKFEKCLMDNVNNPVILTYLLLMVS